MANKFKNILIIKPSSLGDIVLALPALSALRRSFPDAKISWLVRPEFAGLLKNHPHLTEIIPFDRKFLGKAWYNPRAFGALLSLINKLRQSKFDLVIDLQGLFRAASLGWLSGCTNRYGMAKAAEFAHIFYTHKITQDENCIHVVDYYLKIIKAVGASDITVEFVFPQDSAAVESVNKLLAGRDIKPGNYAVLVPGSAHSDKCWPVERFAAIASKISSQFGLSVIATGTATEKTIVEKLKAVSDVPIENFAGLTNLSELIALLKGAKVVLSNDTGPGHIAAALGRPLVLIYGRGNPIRIAPYRRNNCIAAVEPFGRGLKANNTNPRYDVKKVTIDEVYRRMCEQIS
jgi:heptosyltransferase I